jgi:transposase
MMYCGLDAGKKSSHFCIVNEERAVQREGKVRNRVEDLDKVFGVLKPMRIVIEASRKSFWLADQLRRLGHRPVVVDPGKTKAIGASRIKHDKLDARVLAELCQANLLAEVDPPNEQQRLARMPLVARSSMVRARSLLIATAKSLLDSEGIEVPGASSANFPKAVSLASRPLPEAMAAAIHPMLEAIQALTEKIAECEKAIAADARDNPVAQLLRTCPGVGPICSAGYIHAIRDPRRFSSGRAVGTYLGLVPTLYASGGTYRRGRITKCGNRQARWLLTMAANSLLRSRQDSAIKRWGLKLAAKSGRKKAVTAVSRKLAAVLWAMWRKGRPFEHRIADAPRDGAVLQAGGKSRAAAEA